MTKRMQASQTSTRIPATYNDEDDDGDYDMMIVDDEDYYHDHDFRC